MQIWPAIDIHAGKCVRLTQGDYLQETVYGDSPADMAHRWVAEGATCLHIVDLDAARDGNLANRAAIAEIANEVNAECQIGGGIRNESTIREYLDLGITRLVIGTAAVKNPQWAREMTEKYPNRLVVAIDSRDGKAATDGWIETTGVSYLDHARTMSATPIAGIIYTDIVKDGMLAGPNVEALKELKSEIQVPIIASGGVTTSEDISQLASLGIAGCIVGRALYEGRLTLTKALAAGAADNAAAN